MVVERLIWALLLVACRLMPTERSPSPLSSSSTTRRAALGLTAASTAGFLLDRALAPERAAAAEGVTSVNGKTGAVVLGAAEVGAVPCVDVTSKGIEGGDTNQSAAIQKVLNEVSEAGGGVVVFPPSGTKAYYRMQEVSVPSNVWLWQQGDVEFRPPQKESEYSSEHINVLVYSSGWESATYTENVGSIGRLRINLSEVPSKIKGAAPLVKAVLFSNVRNGVFPWLDVIPCSSTTTGAVAFEANANSTPLPPTCLSIGLITLGATGSPANSSDGVQITAAKDCHIGAIRAVGGAACRLELDGPNVSFVEGLRVDQATCDEGFSALTIIPHETTGQHGELRGVHVGTVIARACATAVHIAAGEKMLPMGQVTIDSVNCNGSGASETDEDKRRMASTVRTVRCRSPGRSTSVACPC